MRRLSGRLDEIGRKLREFVHQNFLIARHLNDCLTLMLGLSRDTGDHIELE